MQLPHAATGHECGGRPIGQPSIARKNKARKATRTELHARHHTCRVTPWRVTGRVWLARCGRHPPLFLSLTTKTNFAAHDLSSCEECEWEQHYFSFYTHANIARRRNHCFPAPAPLLSSNHGVAAPQTGGQAGRPGDQTGRLSRAGQGVCVCAVCPPSATRPAAHSHALACIPTPTTTRTP